MKHEIYKLLTATYDDKIKGDKERTEETLELFGTVEGIELKNTGGNMEDEVNLIDYIKVIIKRRYTILGIILIGVLVAVGLHLKPVEKVYQATGHYKLTERFQYKLNPEQIAIKAKQIANEITMKYPNIKVSEKQSIITIKAIGKIPEKLENRCRMAAKGLPIKQIVGVSSNLVKQKKSKKALIMIVFMLLALFVGFLKEWLSNNWRELWDR